LQEDVKPKQQFLYIVDDYNKSEWKLARSIIEENNTNPTINTTYPIFTRVIHALF